MGKNVVEPLSLDIIKYILNINDFSEKRKYISQIFYQLMTTKNVKYMTDIFLYNLELIYQQYKKKNFQKNSDSDHNGIYYVCDFYFSFVVSLIINNFQYQEYLQIKTYGFDIVTRDFKSRSFKKLDIYLQLIAKIDTYLEDVIYSGYDMIKSEKKIDDFSTFDFEIHYNNIKNLIASYSRKTLKSPWNKISKNWYEICIQQQT